MTFRNQKSEIRNQKLGFLIFVFCLLNACSFQPIYSQNYRTTQAAGLAAFEIVVSGTDLTPEEGGKNTNIPRRYSELLAAELSDQLSPDGLRVPKQYRLTISFTEMESGQFVNPDGTASRGDLVYSSEYRIFRLSDLKELTGGTIQRVSSYNMSQAADYASYVSIEDARKRGMIELAQDYKLRIAGLMPLLNDPLSRINNPPKKKPKEGRESDDEKGQEEDWAPHIQPKSMYETLRPRQ